MALYLRSCGWIYTRSCFCDTFRCLGIVTLGLHLHAAALLNSNLCTRQPATQARLPGQAHKQRVAVML